jgi:hypothetical protein
VLLPTSSPKIFELPSSNQGATRTFVSDQHCMTNLLVPQTWVQRSQPKCQGHKLHATSASAGFRPRLEYQSRQTRQPSSHHRQHRSSSRFIQVCNLQFPTLVSCCLLVVLQAIRRGRAACVAASMTIAIKRATSRRNLRAESTNDYLLRSMLQLIASNLALLRHYFIACKVS